MTDFLNREYSEQFADWLRSKGESESAIKDQLKYLKKFGRWYMLTRGQELTPEKATEKDLNDYKKYIWGEHQPLPGKRKLLTGNIFWSYCLAAQNFLEWTMEKYSTGK